MVNPFSRNAQGIIYNLQVLLSTRTTKDSCIKYLKCLMIDPGHKICCSFKLIQQKWNIWRGTGMRFLSKSILSLVWVFLSSPCRITLIWSAKETGLFYVNYRDPKPYQSLCLYHFKVKILARLVIFKPFPLHFTLYQSGIGEMIGLSIFLCSKCSELPNINFSSHRGSGNISLNSTFESTPSDFFGKRYVTLSQINLLCSQFLA